MATYDLGLLHGGIWRQWANADGQSYFQDVSTGSTQYAIPQGYEAHSSDSWTLDTSSGYSKWTNTRTGLVTLIDPAPAPATYLDLVDVKAHLHLVETAPESHEDLYRRFIMAILHWFYTNTATEQYSITQEESLGETSQGESRADAIVLRIFCRPGGSFYGYEILVGESKKLGEGWLGAEDQLSRHCSGVNIDSGQVYGFVHVGLHLQLYKADKGVLTPQTGRLHMRNDVAAITSWFQWMKQNPLPTR